MTRLLHPRLGAFRPADVKERRRAPADAALLLPVVAPSDTTASAFDDISERLISRTPACRREGRSLAALRDALLPTLISGALRAHDAARFAEAAT